MALSIRRCRVSGDFVWSIGSTMRRWLLYESRS
jgi:hypothetical protein